MKAVKKRCCPLQRHKPAGSPKETPGDPQETPGDPPTAPLSWEEKPRRYLHCLLLLFVLRHPLTLGGLHHL